MATSKNKKNQLFEKLGTGWGVFLSALTIFSLGFGTGCYVKETLSKLESFEDRAAGTDRWYCCRRHISYCQDPIGSIHLYTGLLPCRQAPLHNPDRCANPSSRSYRQEWTWA